MWESRPTLDGSLRPSNEIDPPSRILCFEMFWSLSNLQLSVNSILIWGSNHLRLLRLFLPTWSRLSSSDVLKSVLELGWVSLTSLTWPHHLHLILQYVSNGVITIYMMLFEKDIASAICMMTASKMPIALTFVASGARSWFESIYLRLIATDRVIHC